MSVQQQKIIALKNPSGTETAILRISAEQIRLDCLNKQYPKLTLLIFKTDKKLTVFYHETNGKSAIFNRKKPFLGSDFNTDDGFAALVINSEIKPMFFADCRKNAESNTPQKTIGEILTLYEKDNKKKSFYDNPTETGIFCQNPRGDGKPLDLGAADNRREDAEYNQYDDEALATVNYYENCEKVPVYVRERGFGEKTKGEENDVPYNENESSVKPPRRENAQKTDGTDFCENEIGTGNRPPRQTFYQSIKDKLEKIFDEHPAEREPAEIIPESRWVRINYSGDKYYILGVICENGIPLRVVYGVPGEKSRPPHGFERYSEFIPKSLFAPEGEGYWCLFQSAETGESENTRR